MAPVAPRRTPNSGVCIGQVLGPVPRRPALIKALSPTTRRFRLNTPADRVSAASRHWSTTPRSTARPSSTRACSRAITEACSSSRRRIPGVRERARGIRARATANRGQDRGGEFGGGSSATIPLMTGGRRLCRRRTQVLTRPTYSDGADIEQKENRSHLLCARSRGLRLAEMISNGWMPLETDGSPTRGRLAPTVLPRRHRLCRNSQKQVPIF
jgi:hypothetical protein